MKPLKIRDIVAPIPVIQGGMSVGISLSGLASAVAKKKGGNKNSLIEEYNREKETHS